MSKSFTEREREMIHQALIEACKTCWNRYGYQKTGIRELTELAGISPAAFYHFFASKELLFVETAQNYEKEMEAIFEENMRKHPDKRGIAESLKGIAAFIAGMPWISSLWEEWPVIERKLPPDFVERDFLKDMMRIEKYMTLYGLQPRQSLELATQVVDIILASVAQKKFLPGDTSTATDFIIDAAVEQLFE